VFSPTVQIILWSLAAGLVCALWILVRKQRALLAEQVRVNEELAVQGLTLRRMQQSIESASDAIGIGEMDGTSLYHNRAHRALFGYTVEELNAQPGSGVLFADPEVGAEIHQSIRNGRSWTGETEVRTRGGRLVPVQVQANIIRDDTGQPVGIFGVFTDISERLRVGQQLIEQRYRLEITLQSISDAVVTLDRTGRIVLMNPAFEQLLGVTRAAAVNRPMGEILRLLDEHTKEPCESPIVRLMNDTTSASKSASVYRLAATSTLPERIIAENTSLIRSSDGGVAGAVLALRDITRERQQADETARAGKLESLGLLAGGIAHDFGNLLAAMLANISLAQFEPGVSPAVRDRLTQLERVVWRARDITQQLLTFARGETPKKRAVSLPPLIREAVQFAVGGHPVGSQLSFSPELWPVEAEEGQLLQVINNLALNAVQAMANGGKLTITASNYRPDPAVSGPLAIPLRPMVEILVVDTGAGISPQNLPKIFDPFFTTKKTGSGLGLSTSYTIVKQHGGKMRVESTVGRGTSFQILLPASADAAAVQPPSETIAPGTLQRLGRVLVMDDERAVREAIVLMLSMLNYDAIEARNGEEAITLYTQAQGTSRPIDALIVDLRISDGLDGEETVKRLTAIDPRLKAIVTSGHPDHPAMQDYLRYGFGARLLKPIAMSDLKSLLSRMLQR